MAAHQNNLSRRCGALTEQAGRLAAPTAYPQISNEPRTPGNHASRAWRLATCSPTILEGRRSATRRQTSGQRWRPSANHAWRQSAHIAKPARRGHQTRFPLAHSGQNSFFPATENGGHGADALHQSGHPSTPAIIPASPHPEIPAKKWHCPKPRKSSDRTSTIERSSTSPSGINLRLMSSRSHAAQNGSTSL